MASRQAGYAGRQLRTLFGVGTLSGLTDGQLLSRLAAGDLEVAHAAFSALVERHGPMVLRVCRGVLDNSHDAHDAFQATFLVLFRKAGGVRRHDSLGSWLHGVALRVASRARAEAARRSALERRGGLTAREDAPAADREDLNPILHEEIRRLPEKYRGPIVLCYLEGMTHDEAAAHLGWPVGTVRGRLARARDLLRARLTRRGLIVTIAGTSAGSAEAAVPAALLEATIAAATAATAAGPPTPVRVTSWAGAESLSMSLSAIKVVAATLLVVVATAAGAGLATRAAPDETPAAGEPPRAAEARPAPSPDDRDEIVGTWTTSTTVTRTVKGKPLPPETEEARWVITADRIVQTSGLTPAGDESTEHVYRYSLDPSAAPKAIDITSHSTGTLRGIYRLEGDTLTVRYGLDGRPKGFANGEDPGAVQHILKRVKRTAEPTPSRFANADGCEWAIFPEDIGFRSGVSSNRGGIVLMIDREIEGALLVSLAHPGRTADAPAPEYRPVAFDAQRRRYPLKPSGGGEGGNPKLGPTVALHSYRLDPQVLPPEKATHLGVEVVTPEARHVLAEAARAKAKAAGIEVLPPPVVGKPFDFSITTTGGHTLRSRDLKGRVVLIDCWATWCSPCMQKMPALKALYGRRHRDGLEILGISFDKRAEDAEEAITSLGLAWPQALVPNDDATRALWADASQIDGLPRLFLIDREGILRSVGGLADLDARVGALLDEPAKP